MSAPAAVEEKIDEIAESSFPVLDILADYGTSVFIPNAIVMASKIFNYSDTETRRIEIFLSVNNDSNLKETRSTFVNIMSDDERVLMEPKPPVTHVTNFTASGGI